MPSFGTLNPECGSRRRWRSRSRRDSTYEQEGAPRHGGYLPFFLSTFVTHASLAPSGLPLSGRDPPRGSPRVDKKRGEPAGHMLLLSVSDVNTCSVTCWAMTTAHTAVIGRSGLQALLSIQIDMAQFRHDPARASRRAGRRPISFAGRGGNPSPGRLEGSNRAWVTKSWTFR